VRLEDISENKAGKVQKEPDPLPVAVSTRKEQKQVEERMAIEANVVYEAIRRGGVEELNRPATALAWSGLAAGLSMGFSFIA
jgi:hypothetical protein